MDTNSHIPENEKIISKNGEASGFATPVSDRTYRIDDYLPSSGRFIGEDGKAYNLVELLRSASSVSPVSDRTYRIDDYLPSSGRFIGEDGKAYNLVELLQNVSSGGGTSDIAWLPNVSENGDLSFTRSSITIPPDVVNIRGSDGKDGQDGQDGQSAFEAAVANGFVGTVTEWLESLHGSNATINGFNALEFVDSDSVAVEIYNGVMKFHTLNADTSGTTGMLFLSRQDGNAVLTNEMPTESQEITERRWVNANWGEWTDIASFTMASDVADKEVILNPGNRFFAKLWLSSDVERPNAQLRLTITDSSDGAELATASTIVNLLNISSILTPAVFDTKYKVSRTIPLSQMVITLSVMVLAQGVQFGIVSNLPNEKSYIASISMGGAGSSGTIANQSINAGTADFTLESTAWVDSHQMDNYVYQADIIVESITDNDTAQVFLSTESAVEAEKYFILPSAETHNGFIRIFARRKPEVPLGGVCVVYGGI